MPSILTLNGGSSSLKFALFKIAQPLKLLYSGKIDRIGSSNSSLEIIDHTKNTTEQVETQASSHEAGLEALGHSPDPPESEVRRLERP